MLQLSYVNDIEMPKDTSILYAMEKKMAKKNSQIGTIASHIYSQINEKKVLKKTSNKKEL